MSAAGLRRPMALTLAAAFGAAACGACYWRFGLSAALAPALAFSIAALTLAIIDLRHWVLPDALTLPLLWLGLLVNSAGLFISPRDAILGACAGYLALRGIATAFELAAGYEGMGGGDVKLFAALGAWLGWQSLPTVLLLASLSGLLAACARLLARRRWRARAIPFGPHLALAGWLLLLWGERLRSTSPF